MKMATIATSAPLIRIPPNQRTVLTGSALTFPFRNLHLRPCGPSNSFLHFPLQYSKNKKKQHVLRIVRSVEDETLVVPEEQQAVQEEEASSPSSSEQPLVSVPVSPSDTLTMFFQAEGTMNEAAIPTVTKALEGTEDITNLKVQIAEGIASVELAKQTTVQATGVASGLVETIQSSGFKLQTLNLSFDDEQGYLA